jgi:hypothetical protein
VGAVSSFAPNATGRTISIVSVICIAYKNK